MRYGAHKNVEDCSSYRQISEREHTKKILFETEADIIPGVYGTGSMVVLSGQEFGHAPLILLFATNI
jgi:hypothetical protein